MSDKFGASGPRTGAIDICAQCRNKAEVAVYPNDNPQPICEACYRDNQTLEGQIRAKQEAAAAVSAEGGEYQRMTRPERQVQYAEPDREREEYLRVIFDGADDKWVKKLIKETLAKDVLLYDWKHILKFERWFSVLDLRRFALSVNPNFENPRRVPETDSVDSLMGAEVVVKPRKKRKTQQGAA